MMNDQELREIIAGLAKDTDRTIRNLARQIGGLGNKFGSFTEGLMMPSLKKTLKDKFRVEVISSRVEARKGEKSIELDLLAYSNGTRNQAFLVEIKSHLDDAAIKQIKKQLIEFPLFFPEHKNKALFGILAAVDFTDEMARKVIKEGIYPAHIHDEVFRLQIPAGFRPKSFKI